MVGGEEPREDWSQHPGLRTSELQKGDDRKRVWREQGLSQLTWTGWLSELSPGAPMVVGEEQC